ncbi:MULTISPECIES: GNAT family N-acetyltransferase [unclassified Cryobacterium]|uniref:GNAT family N-acetyltransferase n=1 Tax=unclassified Cryobacterium TaxID=2649013 RepID=UPI0010694C75|nr:MULTISPECIES: GNAT family protein [unclassified Cryobacterium]TFD05995.1 N-acetyltransferase [Cryobacterium sp. TMT1-66-1]TFD10070.1 N-acetyltransferase [Cryobacterium sp. TMT1-2-2]
MCSPAFPLSTDRLVLRLHVASDAHWLLGVYSQPDVAIYLLDEPWTVEVARAKSTKRVLQTGLDGVSGALALVIEHEGAPVGDVLLWFTDLERRCTEIGWVLDPKQGGRGFASEAVSAVLDLAFDEYDVHRVAAQMDGRNAASSNLARRVGMQHEGQLRQSWWSKGEWADTVVFGLLASDRT